MSNPVVPSNPTASVAPSVAAIEVEQIVEQQVQLPPSEPDWDLWYRAHPAACQHIPTLHGHCDRCGVCMDPARCNIMIDLEALRDDPTHSPPVSVLGYFREKINKWVVLLLALK